MSNKRVKKKQQKQKLQKNLITKGYQEKELKQYSFKSLLSIAQKEEKREKKRKSAENTYNKKIVYLQAIGVNTDNLSKNDLRKVKIKELEQGKVNRLNHPWLYRRKINWNKTVNLTDGKAFLIAYRDFSGERSFSECLADFEGLSIEELLGYIKYIMSLGHQYNKRIRSGSSGSAGDYKFIYGKESYIELSNQQIEIENENEPKRFKNPWRESQRTYKGFQILKSNGSVAIKSFTPKRLLVVANAVLHNVTELERTAFYESLYRMIEKEVNEMTDYIPKP